MAVRQPQRLKLSTALRSAFLGYCPNCMLGRLHKGLLRAHESCPVCEMPFEHQGGTCMATAVLLYFLICFGLAVEGLTLGLLFGLFSGFIAVLLASAAVMFLVLHRPVRGLWVWCLWRMGYLQ